MPKFLAGKVTLVTWELEAESKDAAEKAIAQAENPLNEKENAEIKRTVHKFGWFEFDLADPLPARNLVLQKFLQLMDKLPKPVIRLIQHPFNDGKIGR